SHGGAISTLFPYTTLFRSLVRKLFALEVPEIASGLVEITALAREAGHRTKIAVKANDPSINAKGACIGELGRRVRAVTEELSDRSEEHTSELQSRENLVCR